SVQSRRSPARAFRTRRSMQARKAAKVLPDPVGAEIRVVRPSTMCDQPCSCGSVGVPKRLTNHSCTRGCAHSKLGGTFIEGRDDIVSHCTRERWLSQILRPFWGGELLSNFATGQPICRRGLGLLARAGS